MVVTKIFEKVCKFRDNAIIYREKGCQNGTKSDIIRNNGNFRGENEWIIIYFGFL